MEKFFAVEVVGGRIFKGAAYRIPGEYTQRFGYADSGVFPLSFTEKVKIWIPETNKTCYVNDKFVEEREVTEEQEKADFTKYGKGVLESTMNWCRSKSVGKADAEVIKFAYNVVRKNHPEFIPLFEEVYSFKEDVAEVVGSSIQWALGLGYRSDKGVRIAFRCLSKKGITTKPGFKAAWKINLDLRGLGKYADKYIG